MPARAVEVNPGDLDPPKWIPPGRVSVVLVRAHMQTLLRVRARKRLEFAGWLVASSLFAISSPAQQPAARITTSVDDAERTAIHGTHPVMARTEDDAGRVPLGNKLQGVSIAFIRTPAQEAD